MREASRPVTVNLWHLSGSWLFGIIENSKRVAITDLDYEFGKDFLDAIIKKHNQ